MSCWKSIGAALRSLLVFLAMPVLTAHPQEHTNQLLSKIVVLRAGGISQDGPWNTNCSNPMTLDLPKPARIEISFTPVDSVSNEPIRFIGRLENAVNDWIDVGGEMQLLVITHSSSNQILSYDRFAMMKKTEGWNGTAEQSTFRLRREEIVIPEGAKSLQVVLISEEWSVLGSAAIADFHMLHKNSLGQEEDIWPNPNFDEGENLDSPHGNPRFWQRGSLGSRMAQIIKAPPPIKGNALVIKDDDLHLSASWQADLPLDNRVHAGETLTLQWREAFSIGIGARNRVTIEPLAPGSYVFRLKTTTAFEQPIGRELALTINIPVPLWKRPSFTIAMALLTASVIAGLVWFTVNRRLRARMNRLEHRRQMEHERLRIAQDIHDDLGASLTQINLLSQTAHSKLDSSHPAWHDIERLRSMAVVLTQKLDEIVWAVNPRHDTLESLLSYLSDFAEDFLEAAGLRARIQIPVQIPEWVLSSTVRHNVFLAAKEALNNTVKHAQASEIHLRLAIHPQSFELLVQDNGRGFPPPPESPTTGNHRNCHGLDSMRNRMLSIEGSFQLATAPGRGTRLVFTVPVREATR